MYTIARFVSLLMPRAMPNFWTNWLSRGFIGILTSKQNTFFVIGHENGHSFGPDSLYQSALGAYKHIIEEHKADVISLAFMPEYVKMGVISEDMLKKVYLTHTVSGLFLKAEPNMSLPHRIADLIQFNYLFGARGDFFLMITANFILILANSLL